MFCAGVVWSGNSELSDLAVVVQEALRAKAHPASFRKENTFGAAHRILLGKE
jgi:hypothetical protein